MSTLSEVEAEARERLHILSEVVNMMPSRFHSNTISHAVPWARPHQLICGVYCYLRASMAALSFHSQ